jgi:hypothetical protein
MTITHPSFRHNPVEDVGLLRCRDGSVSMWITANV